MGTEIERKFLVTGDGWKQLVARRSALKQGYLSSNSKATVRVRTWDDARAAITLKSAVQGRSRAEFEYDIPIEDARELLALAAPNIVEKQRHDVPIGSVVWEVDVFEGRHEGLIIAEVELESDDQVVDLPDWVGTEVTDDDRYYNASLSRTEGVPEPTASA